MKEGLLDERYFRVRILTDLFDPYGSRSGPCEPAVLGSFLLLKLTETSCRNHRPNPSSCGFCFPHLGKLELIIRSCLVPKFNLISTKLQKPKSMQISNPTYSHLSGTCVRTVCFITVIRQRSKGRMFSHHS